MKKTKSIINIVLLLAICASAVLLLFFLPDRTKITTITITQLPVSNNLSNIYQDAKKDAVRYTLGGCKEYPGGESSDYISVMFSAKIDSNKSIHNKRLIVSDFGNYAERWLFADHAIGESSSIVAILYVKDLNDDQVQEAISQMQLTFGYVCNGKAKDIPVVFSADDLPTFVRG